MKVVKPKYYDNYQSKGTGEEVRRLIKLGQIYERSLDMSDPEVAHIILNQTEPVEFILVNESVAKDDQKLLMKLNFKDDDLLRMSDIRALFVIIAQYRDIPVWQRLLLIRKYAMIIEQKIKDNTYEEALINSLYQEIEAKETLEELENAPQNIETKYFTLNAVMNFKEEFITSNQDFYIFDNWHIFYEFMKSEACDAKILKEIDSSWKEYIKDKEFIFEHYLVYYLFSYFMQIGNKTSIVTEFNLLILYISLIEYNMEIKWYLNKKVLTQEEIEKIISNMVRILEHDKKFKLTIKSSSFLNTLNSIVCCSFLLR